MEKDEGQRVRECFVDQAMSGFQQGALCTERIATECRLARPLPAPYPAHRVDA